MIKNTMKNEKAYVVVSRTNEQGYLPYVLNECEEARMHRVAQVIVSVECDTIEEARSLFWYMADKCKELNNAEKNFLHDVLVKRGFLPDTRVQELGAEVFAKELENEAPLTSDEVYELADAMFGDDGDEIASKYLK